MFSSYFCLAILKTMISIEKEIMVFFNYFLFI